MQPACLPGKTAADQQKGAENTSIKSWYTTSLTLLDAFPCLSLCFVLTDSFTLIGNLRYGCSEQWLALYSALACSTVAYDFEGSQLTCYSEVLNLAGSRLVQAVGSGRLKEAMGLPSNLRRACELAEPPLTCSRSIGQPCLPGPNRGLPL